MCTTPTGKKKHRQTLWNTTSEKVFTMGRRVTAGPLASIIEEPLSVSSWREPNDGDAIQNDGRLRLQDRDRLGYMRITVFSAGAPTG